MKKLIIGFVAILVLLLVFSAAGWAAETQTQTVDVQVTQSMGLYPLAPQSFIISPGNNGNNGFQLNFSTNVSGSQLKVEAPATDAWSKPSGATTVPELGIGLQSDYISSGIVHDDNTGYIITLLTNIEPGLHDIGLFLEAKVNPSVLEGHYSTTLTYSLTGP